MKISILFGMMFLLFIPSAYACMNPVLYTEEGSAINPFGGWLIINGTTGTELERQYNLEVRNENDQVLIVTLQPSDSIKDYISGGSISVEPKSRKNMTLNVWVGGLSKSGTLDVFFICENEFGQYIFPYVNVHIIGNQISPPSSSTCDSFGLDGCYEGMYRSYYCSNDELQYNSVCIKSCCKRYGGEDAFCSADKRTCISPNNLPPGTEGNIAFLCSNDKCDKKIERQIMFLFRLLGWNVTKKAHTDWNETELDKHNIIVCTDESRACKIDFNSLVYNQHVEKGKPILEISDSRSAKAAYYLDYINKFSSSLVKESVTITSNDIITEGYSGSVSVTTERPNFVAISPSYFTEEVTNLADAGTSEKSVFFKVDAANHGKYAFIGWLMGYESGTLTEDGEVLLNRTLRWLKEDFELPNPGEKIAYICSKDDCSKESDLMKILRKNGYSVTGKEKESWTEELLNNFDLIICSSYKTCDIEKDSIFYNSHLNNGKGFIELPDSTKIYAGYIFDYITSSSGSRKSSSEIEFVASNSFTEGFPNDIQLFERRKSMSGASIDDLNSVTDIAHIKSSRSRSPISTMFNSDASGNKGRYFYIGWFGKNSIDDLTYKGKGLLLRAIKWTLCGDGCLEPFDGNPNGISIDIHSPLADETYGERKVLIDVSTSIPVNYIYKALNTNRFSELCEDCDSYSETSRAREGLNELTIRAIDYDGVIIDKTIIFFVDTTEPRIRSIAPRDGEYIGGSNFTVYYDEDFVNNVSLFYGTEGNMNEYFMDYCPSGRRQECTASVDLAAFNNQTIQYYFVIWDAVNKVTSDTNEVIVDGTLPIVTVHSPENETYDSSRVLINITVSEDVKLEYSDNGGSFRRLCSRCDSYDRTRSFRYGTHDLLIRATDKAGNENLEVIKFNVI